MTDHSERDPARNQRPAPPYKRRPGDAWREELPPITRYLYDYHVEPQPDSSQPGEYAEPPRKPVLESIEWTSAYATQGSAPRSGERDASGAWILEEWEQYDWKKAATLTADPEIIAAQEAWGDLDWEADAGSAPRQRSPEMIATILEGIAKRIRSGEVRVSGSPGMTDEAVLTAVLAALLGARRD